MKSVYYKVKNTHRPYLGERYFKFNDNMESVVQVCLYPGDVKKGKSNTLGIFMIHRSTLFQNYIAPGYTEPCTKSEYFKNFKKVLKQLI